MYTREREGVKKRGMEGGREAGRDGKTGLTIVLFEHVRIEGDEQGTHHLWDVACHDQQKYAARRYL